MRRPSLNIESAANLLRALVANSHYQEALIGLLALAGVPQAIIVSLQMDEFVLGTKNICLMRLSSARPCLNPHPATSDFNILRLLDQAAGKQIPRNGSRDIHYAIAARTTRWMQLRFPFV